MRTNVEMAVSALVQVRDTVGMNVSTNRGAMHGMSDGARHAEMQRWAKAIFQINDYRGWKPRTDGLATAESVLDYGGRVLAGNAGNCFELVCAAARCLAGFEEGPRWNLVSLVRADHSFAVIAPPVADRCNLYPSLMEEWPEDSAVCDPWMDIACRARDYPEHFVSRLKNYANIGVGFGASEPYDHPMSWMNKLQALKMPMVMSVPPRPDMSPYISKRPGRRASI